MKKGKINRLYESANLLLDLAIEELVNGNYSQAEDHADTAGYRFFCLHERLDSEQWPGDLCSDMARASAVCLLARRLRDKH
jgi:hypothetical protein